MRDASCSTGSFHTAISQSPPLVFYNHATNKTVGILPKLLNQMMEFCCNESANFSITRIAENPQALHQLLDDDEEIVMPFTQSGAYAYQVRQSSFLPVVTSPGAMFLVDLDNEIFDLFGMMSVAWKMLLFIIISCCAAGIIMWILDTYGNQEIFPRSFHTGFWEGTWWAFVSMTTVGYGDVTPKSIAARIFAMLWIIAGICVFTIFTATLTAALTKEAESKNSLHGRLIGVLNGTDEVHVSSLLGATSKAYSSIEEMINHIPSDLKNKKIEGVLVDNVYVSQLSPLIGSSLRTFLHIPLEKTHGILFQELEDDVVNCFQKYGRKMKYDPHIVDVLESEVRIPKVQGTDTIDSWLKIQTTHLAIYAACTFGVFLLLLLWEFVYWRPKHITTVTKGRNVHSPPQQHQNEQGKSRLDYTVNLCRECKQRVPSHLT